MANCDIEVLLDKSVPSSPEEPVYPYGAQVGVVARVVVDEAVNCDDLTLELRSQHADHVNAQTRVADRPGAHSRSAKHSLFKGQLPAGTHEYRASLPVPWPPSYAGHQISWSWAAVVCADIP